MTKGRWFATLDFIDMCQAHDLMSAQATLCRSGGFGASAQVATVELGLVNDRYTVKKVTLAQSAE